MVPARRLETTLESCRMAAQMAEPNSMDEWIALDAQAAHELLELVVKMRAGLQEALVHLKACGGTDPNHGIASSLKASEAWVN